MPGSHYDWLVTLAEAIGALGILRNRPRTPSDPVDPVEPVHRGLPLGCGMSDWCKALQGSRYKTWPMEVDLVDLVDLMDG